MMQYSSYLLKIHFFCSPKCCQCHRVQIRPLQSRYLGPAGRSVLVRPRQDEIPPPPRRSLRPRPGRPGQPPGEDLLHPAGDSRLQQRDPGWVHNISITSLFLYDSMTVDSTVCRSIESSFNPQIKFDKYQED